MRHLLLLLLLFLGVKCSPKTSKSSDQTSSLQRKWMIIALGDISKSDLIKQNAYIDLTQDQGNVSVGCNTLRFKYSAIGSKLTVRNIISTRMLCQDLMKAEGMLGSYLREASTFEIEGHVLKINTSSGKSIKCVAQDWD